MSVDTLDEVLVAPVTPEYQFSGNDRCCADKGTRGFQGTVVVAEQAYHRWTKGDKEILLCNHHNRLYESGLFVSGWDVQHHPLHDQLDKPLDINHIDEE